MASVITVFADKSPQLMVTVCTSRVPGSVKLFSHLERCVAIVLNDGTLANRKSTERRSLQLTETSSSRSHRGPSLAVIVTVCGALIVCTHAYVQFQLPLLVPLLVMMP